MECKRCDGFLVSVGAGFHDDPDSDSLRCVNCGDLIDPVILQNRIAPRKRIKTPRHGEGQPHNRNNPEEEHQLNIPPFHEPIVWSELPLLP